GKPQASVHIEQWLSSTYHEAAFWRERATFWRESIQCARILFERDRSSRLEPAGTFHRETCWLVSSKERIDAEARQQLHDRPNPNLRTNRAGIACHLSL